MKLSKQAQRLLNRILKNDGCIQVNEYSDAFYNMTELKELGLVEKVTSVSYTYHLGRYEHLYELSTPDILDDEDDIKFFLRQFKKPKRKKIKLGCPACGGQDHTMMNCQNASNF